VQLQGSPSYESPSLRMTIHAIVAVDEKNGIGFSGKLPWSNQKEDMARFRDLTICRTIIMGRITAENIWQKFGSGLPERRNLALSTDPELDLPGFQIVNSIEASLDAVLDQEVLLVIGGGKIYRLFWDHIERLFLTKIHHAFECDTFFPELDMNEWSLDKEEHFQADSRNTYDYSFFTYNRKKVA